MVAINGHFQLRYGAIVRHDVSRQRLHVDRLQRVISRANLVCIANLREDSPVIPLRKREYQHGMNSLCKYCCRLVLYVNGERVVTDVKINDDYWHFLCVAWESERGSWRVSVDGILKDSGVALAQGTVVRGIR